MVRRRNANGALAKSRIPRSVPVTAEVVGFYAEATDSDMVFVNLFRGVLGRAMTYSAVKDMFDRLARRAKTVSYVVSCSLGCAWGGIHGVGLFRTGCGRSRSR
ncbi:hypothetical protein ACFV8T_44255 [Streptomyces sp. NPDC059832]|uniref:hypothetical protein n=1 Tax=Streptomyces sp. NPDC059832 TaxID=3346966 RepID=UPI0036556B07